MLQRAPETSQRERVNYLSSFDMLNYMGSIARREMNHLRLYCMAEVTNIEILEISKIHENLICLDKMSVIILVIMLKC